MPLPPVDETYLLEFLCGLLNTPSPTGFTDTAIEYTEKALSAFPELRLERTNKGALLVTWPGERNDSPRALTAHVDTLGAMVKEIKSSGRLKLTKIGGYAWNTVEGEGCTIFTNTGGQVRGSLLLIALVSCLFLLSGLGIGLFASTIAHTQQEAMLTVWMTLLPAIFLSGFLFPLANMPKVLLWISYFIPLRYYLNIIRVLLLKGVGLESIQLDVFALAVFGTLIMGAAAMRFRKRLD